MKTYRYCGRIRVAFLAVAALCAAAVPLVGSGPLVATESHGLTIAGNTSICAVGENSFGQLGDGTTADRFVPVTTSFLGNATGISTSWYHSLAVLSNGSVWAWGYNNTGQIGDGTVNTRFTPTGVATLSGMTAVAAGQFHSLALRSDGTVWAWGDNGNGRLGDGTITTKLLPVQVTGLSGAIAIGAGQSHSIALKSDGTVWTWGYNGYGQLGNGGFTESSTPTQVTGLTGVAAIAAGSNHNLALKNDGTLWTWGNNVNGQLGNGSLNNSPTPVRAGTLTNVVGFAGGFIHSIAVKGDGTVWTWGDNTNGGLGDGTFTQRPTPVQVNLFGASAVAAGAFYSEALKTDGTMWSWGKNSHGQLGIGSTAQNVVPVQAQTCATGASRLASMLIPGPGSVLSGSSVTFSWASTGASAYWLDVGTAQGQGNLFGQNVGTNTSQTVNGLPTNGSTIYVRLWSFINGAWQSNSYTYTAGGAGSQLATLSAPTPGSTLAGSSAAFSWNSTGAAAYWLDVGTSPGVGNIFGQNVGLNTSQIVNGLPTNGSTIYVRLWSFVNGTWQFNSYTFTAASGAVQLATIASPTPGSTLSSAVTFSWTPISGASGYWLDVGTAPFQGNISSGALTATSKLVTGLPLDGSTIYVTLYTAFNGSYSGSAGYFRNSYTYTAGRVSTIISPTPGFVFTSSSATFTWTPVTGATEYWLDVGTAPSVGNISSGSAGTNTSRQVTGIPLDGSTIYATLYTRINGSFQDANGAYLSNSYTYSTVRIGAINSPAPGSTLPGSTVTFSWLPYTGGATQYWLDVGTAPFQGNIFGANVGSVTSQQVSGLPVNGTTVYVTLYTKINGSFQDITGAYIRNSYNYATGTNSLAAIFSPTPGSVLGGSSATFSWTQGAGAAAYWLDVGTANGQGNIFGQNVGLSTSQFVSGLPTNGSTVFVRLWSLINGVWQFNAYTYTSSSGTIQPAVLLAPAGTVLTGSSATFVWNSTGAAAYWLDVGTSPGVGNIFGQNVGTNTSQFVSGLPTNGSTVYVRLWSLINGVWQFNAYTYTAANAIQPAVLSAPVGTTLSGSSVNFTWNPTGAQAYWLDVGTANGQGNIFGQNVGLNTSQLVTGIPTNGSTIYVRLWSLINGVWQFNAYTYTSAGGSQVAALTSPAGSTLPGSTVNFVWNQTGAQAYWLDVGTANGQGNLFGQNVGTNTSQIVSGIPINGSTIYVRLWSLINGVWQFNSYTFTAAGGVQPAVLSGPVGTTLPGSSATFTWNATGASAYWLDVGTANGQGNIFGQNVGLNTSQLVTGIPTNSSTIYVRLYSMINGVWQFNAYTFNAASGN